MPYTIKLKTFLLFLLMFTALVSGTYAQQITFEKWFDYGQAESGRCVKQTNDGGYIIAGAQYYNGMSNNLLIKTDSVGDETWHRLFGSPGDNIINAIKQTFDGGYIITGQSPGPVTNDRIPFWSKTNSNGNVIWNKQYAHPHSHYGMGADVIQTLDSGYIILADVADSNITSSIILIKTNVNGDTIWTKSITSPTLILTAFQFILTPDSGCIIVGVGSFGSPIQSDIYLARTNSNGDTLWTKQISVPDNQGASNIVFTNDSNYLLRGGYILQSNSNSYLYLVKINSVGDTLWAKKIGDGYFDGGFGLDNTTNNGFIISGTMDVNNIGLLYIREVDENGDSLWTKTYGYGAWNNYAAGLFIQHTADGGFVATGDRGTDAYLIKTDSLGFVSWIKDLQSPPVKFCKMGMPFPNPATSEVTVTVLIPYFETTGNQPTNLYIYNMQRRELYKTDLTTGINNVTVDVSSYAQGEYLFIVSLDGYAACSQKFLKQ